MVLFEALLFWIIQSVELKHNISECGYIPVPSCPNNSVEWEESTLRLGCNDSHKYHCSSYNTSQLYEFCYLGIEVKKGHCLAIRDDCNINEEICGKYFSGCPSEDYNSSEAYKYPNCLSIHGGCRTKDRLCNFIKKLEANTTASQQNDRSRPNMTTTIPNSTCTCGLSNESDPCENQSGYLIALSVVCLILLIISAVVNVFQFCIIKRKQLRQGCGTNEPTDEELRLLRGQNCETESQDIPNCVTRNTGCNGLDDIFRLTLVNYTIEDAELFILLKRQCLHKAFREFRYLVDSRVKGKKEYIFKKRDENGCILLHYAAQGGSIVILDYILENVPSDILEDTCIRGQNALHFAISNDQSDMTIHLIKKYSNLLRGRNVETMGIEQNQRTNNLHIDGVFAPVHWVAWQGKTWLLRELKDAHFDISKKTRNGLDILDIACMANFSDESHKFCIHVLTKELACIDPMKTDLSGWNRGHFASMSGRVELLKFMDEDETLRPLITARTKSLKTSLHIACQFAKVDVVKFLVSKFASLSDCEDDMKWNALHFAAKGGNLEILRYLIQNGLQIGSLTKDQKTILHVACIHKKLDICKYAVSHFSKHLLNIRTDTSGLQASHYLAVEKKEEGNEAKILEVLCGSEMDLTKTCSNGRTLLEWAIDHLNIDLIRAIVSDKFREKCGVTTQSLITGQKRTQNQKITIILETALNEMNSE